MFKKMVVALVVVGSASAVVRADLPTGFGLDGPYEGNSFYFVGFSTSIAIDKIVVQHNSGAAFEPDALIEFSSDSTFTTPLTGWTQTWNDGNYAVANGPAGGSAPIFWKFHFAGNTGDPVSFDFAVWAPGEDNPLFVVTVQSFDGAVAAVGTSEWTPTRDDIQAPLPQAVYLGALGLGMVGWARRRLA